LDLQPLSGNEVHPDSDPVETQEWFDAFSGPTAHAGKGRGTYLLRRLNQYADECGLADRRPSFSAYRNTISPDDQGRYPGDLAMEERLSAIIRWNALAMVVRANNLGGHAKCTTRGQLKMYQGSVGT
jgi:pyruvate dehydrogenase E1 component